MSKNSLILAIILLSSSALFAQTKSFKRGVGYGYHSVIDMQNFSKHISWWYNWSALPEASVRNTYPDYAVDFTPMAWNSSGISAVKNWVNQDTNVNYILGFNEPNFKDQSNMTPTLAAAAWPAFQDIALEHNLKTVGTAEINLNPTQNMPAWVYFLNVEGENCKTKVNFVYLK